MAAARKLLRRSERDKRAAFLVEGPAVVVEALAAPVEVHDVFVAEDLDDAALHRGLEARGIAPWIVGRDVIDVLSDTVTPQGVVAVVGDPSAGPEILSKVDLCLVLAEVRDPGNAGTLVRSAAASGAGAVVFTAGSVDPLHPKVVRSAAGALFRVPLVRNEPLSEVVRALREAGVALVGADARGDADMYAFDLSRPVALVVGNESWGFSDATEKTLDAKVRIPMPGAVESLNVSIAGSILLFEALRQRRARH